MYKHLLSRRQFAARCAAGLSLPAISGLLAMARSGAALGATGAAAEAGRHTVRLPRGVTVPALGQGAWHLGQGRHPPEVEEEAVRTGISLGMTLIDTSGNYGNGQSEEFVGRAIAESLIIHDLARGREIDERVAASLAMVGLSGQLAGRMPHEFSGGQRQRICIARALCCGPQFIACDEVLSALDMSLQGQMLGLLERLKSELGLTYLFISHDLRVVRRIADRVAVMYLGRIVELAPTGDLYTRPAHPYTQALLAAVPTPDPGVERARRFVALAGEPPSPARPPPGCAFHERCPRASARCRTELPPLADIAPGHKVACFHPS